MLELVDSLEYIPKKMSRLQTMWLCRGLLFLFVSICSCSAAPQTHNPVTLSSPTPSAQRERTPEEDTELRNQIEQIASVAKGRVGVAARRVDTDQFVLINAREHFPMQSVYKLPIAMAVLAQVDKGKLKLEQRVRVETSDFVRIGQHSPIRDRNPKGVELSLRELLRYAVSESDGTASDVLLELVGVEGVSKYLNELGINEMIVANSEKEIGQDWETQYRNWASPSGALLLLYRLVQLNAISVQSQQLLFKFMIESPTGPKRLKGLLPKTAVVGHKTGTSGTSAEGVTAATNDIGLISLPDGGTLAIAVFVSDSPADLATREKVIAEIAKAAWDKWSSKP